MRADGGETLRADEALAVGVRRGRCLLDEKAAVRIRPMRRRRPEFGHHQLAAAVVFEAIQRAGMRSGAFRVGGHAAGLGQFGEAAVVVGNQVADRLAEVGKKGIRVLAAINDMAGQHRQPGNQIIAASFAERPVETRRPVHPAAFPTVGVDVAQRLSRHRPDRLAQRLDIAVSNKSSSAAGLR